MQHRAQKKEPPQMLDCNCFHVLNQFDARTVYSGTKLLITLDYEINVPRYLNRRHSYCTVEEPICHKTLRNANEGVCGKGNKEPSLSGWVKRKIHHFPNFVFRNLSKAILNRLFITRQWSITERCGFDMELAPRSCTSLVLLWLLLG